MRENASTSIGCSNKDTQQFESNRFQSMQARTSDIETLLLMAVSIVWQLCRVNSRNTQAHMHTYTHTCTNAHRNRSTDDRMKMQSKIFDAIRFTNQQIVVMANNREFYASFFNCMRFVGDLPLPIVLRVYVLMYLYRCAWM